MLLCYPVTEHKLDLGQMLHSILQTWNGGVGQGSGSTEDSSWAISGQAAAAPHLKHKLGLRRLLHGSCEGSNKQVLCPWGTPSLSQEDAEGSVWMEKVTLEVFPI